MSVGPASLITRCPECATAFRATADQLAVREGRVRCGQCGAVFDGRAHEVALEQPVAEFAAEAPGPGPQADVRMAPGMPDHEHDLVLTHAPAGDTKPLEELASQHDSATAASSPDNLTFDFGRTGHAVSRISPWLSWPLLFLLLLILAAQAAYHFRGDIVLLYPQAKPFAERLCVPLACDLPLPRRAELLSIESSDLQADSTNPKVMVLSATLRNRAAFPQSAPALELTLTDTQDQPVARRILAAGDYAGSVAAGNMFPASSEIPVKVYFEASSLKATGYRLYLFYP